MDIEKDIKKVFGVSAAEIALSVINVSCTATFKKDIDIETNMKDQINMALRLYPTLIKTYHDRKDKEDTDAKARDEVFTPLFFSPDSHIKLSHPKPWVGDFRTEAKVKELGLYSTDQMFAKYSNGILGAFLASKYRYNSNKSRNRNLIVDVENISASDSKYVIGRGACSVIGGDSIDSIRYICQYNYKDKQGFSLISGNADFISGIDEVLSNMSFLVNKLKSEQDTYKGMVFTQNTNMYYSSPIQENAESLSPEHYSTMLGRLMIGSIITHDHLWVLKNIFGVEKIFELDDGASKPIKKISIDDVISQYTLAKKYVMSLVGLGLIR